jgi:hypothetical protein
MEQAKRISDRDMLQISAFKAVRDVERKKGKSDEEAFVLAIIATSDDVYDKLPPCSLQRYLNFKNKEKRKGVHKT